ncbi:MAG: antibiotic biosynthesis monooxygenase [Boseongicola sp. SB0676_bin_33]|nr:antibiotic biosynthesis monooxygenase [Boseongicola sp. SB0676_bin_33]
MYVVAVDFRVRPGARDAFMPLILDQARTSLSNEPGCHVFDVCQCEEVPDQIFLYEVYEDRAAFDAHLASDHYSAFDSAVGNLVAEKRVRFLHRKQKATSPEGES